MDVARDLQDHQLLDRDGHACGRIDDIVIRWDTSGGVLGPLLCGGGILLDQLGWFGRLLRPVLRFRGARREVSVDWPQIARVEPHAIHLVSPRDDLELSSIESS